MLALAGSLLCAVELCGYAFAGLPGTCADEVTGSRQGDDPGPPTVYEPPGISYGPHPKEDYRCTDGESPRMRTNGGSDPRSGPVLPAFTCCGTSVIWNRDHQFPDFWNSATSPGECENEHLHHNGVKVRMQCSGTVCVSECDLDEGPGATETRRKHRCKCF